VPKTVTLRVIEAAPGAKGNTSGGRTEKPIKLETGAEIMAPMFIVEGEDIKVDTEERKYLGRSA
jgi:elongation factor P